MKTILADIAKSIVDNPEAVNVVESETENSVLLTLSVAESDVGMVIGKHGRIAKAIRSVMKSASSVTGKKVIVEIR
ncbi:MAG: KH domain-containing protein [Clostridia bacterium]|nr:KH domain-containing protein [Clostridia bacterium]